MRQYVKRCLQASQIMNDVVYSLYLTEKYSYIFFER